MLKGHMKDEYLGFITKYLEKKNEVVDCWVWDTDDKYADAEEMLQKIHKYMMSLALWELAHQFLCWKTYYSWHLGMNDPHYFCEFLFFHSV